MNESNENNSLMNTPKKNDFIDLIKTFEIIHESSKKIILTTIIFGIFGYIFSINQPVIYRAEAFVAPVDAIADVFDDILDVLFAIAAALVAPVAAKLLVVA